MNLIPGTDYTVDASGHYTFDGAFVGQSVTIEYQSTTEAQSALQQLGLGMVTGTPAQPVWGYLATHHADQALGYSGISYVYAPAYDLGGDATVVNHSFEVSTPWAVTAQGDADPARVAYDLLTNPRYGANFPASRVGDVAAWSQYALAANLVASPALTEQKPAVEWLKYLLDMSNTDVTWSQGQLKFVPLGDSACSANGASYAPSLAPVYDLTDDHFLDVQDPPLDVTRIALDDSCNHVRVEYTNRANQYNTETAEAKDAADIAQRGLRTRATVQARAVCESGAAQALAHILLQRELGVRNLYKFTLPWTFALLEPLDIVTVSDAAMGLYRTPVRITQITETDAGEFELEAEDCPIGMASAPAYGAPAGRGFAHDYNATPGSITPPVFFEPPVELTTTGLEVWMAVSGQTAAWGGCNVWASTDGVSFRRVGRISGGARYGTLTTAFSGVSAALGVQLTGQGGAMLSGSTSDAASRQTLLWVGVDGAGEYLSYETATLTGANAYTLSALHRAAFGSVPQARAANSARVVRVDDAVGKSGPLQPDQVGQALHFKFTSFNVYGGGEEALADVAAWSYTPTGYMLYLPPPAFDTVSVLAQPDGTRQYNFGYGVAAPPDWLGAQIRYSTDLAATDWAAMTPLQDAPTYYTHSPVEINAPLEGSYRFAVRSQDKWGALSAPVYYTAVLPRRRVGQAVDEWAEHAEGWLGTLSSCTRLADGTLEAADSATWATLPSTWDAWTRWNTTPASPIGYTSPVRDLGASISGLINGQVQASGTVVQERRVSADGSTWSAWAPIETAFSARYLQVRATVSATGAAPVAALASWTWSVAAETVTEYLNDQDISTYTGARRIGTGDVRAPLTKTFLAIRRRSVAIQDTRAGVWTWAWLDNTLTGPRVQFRLGGTLTDPQLVDFYIEGY
jgi:hypothetical protein